MKSWRTKNGIDIYRIPGRGYNCYLISSCNRHLLIDTGRAGKWEKLIKWIEKAGAGDNPLEALILTHSHYDHAGNAANLKEKYKTTIVVHRNEADYLHNGESPPVRGTASVPRFLTSLDSKNLSRYGRFKPVDADLLVEERFDLDRLGFKGCLVHTPGHTSGSLSVILDDEIAVVGDSMFGIFKWSAFPPFADNPRLLIESWGKLLETKCSIFLPGHGMERSRALLERQYGKYKKKFLT